MRRMDYPGPYLLGDERQSALLPGKSGWPVRDGWRASHDPGVRHEPAVSLLICPLAGNREVGSGRV